MVCIRVLGVRQMSFFWVFNKEAHKKKHIDNTKKCQHTGGKMYL